MTIEYCVCNQDKNRFKGETLAIQFKISSLGAPACTSTNNVTLKKKPLLMQFIFK